LIYDDFHKILVSIGNVTLHIIYKSARHTMVKWHAYTMHVVRLFTNLELLSTRLVQGICFSIEDQARRYARAMSVLNSN